MSVVNVQEDNNEPAIEPQSVVARDDLVVSGWPQATTDRDIFGQLRSRLEKRQPHMVPPWWVPPPVSIAKSADEAIEKHDVIKPGAVCIYIDGTGIHGHVGAAAVAPALQMEGINTTRMHEREVGNWFNLLLYYGLEAMSLMPMVDDLSMDPEVVRNLCREVKKEICALQCRAFCTM